MNPIEQFIKENLELCEKATEGPWVISHYAPSDEAVIVNINEIEVLGVSEWLRAQEEDIDFIANSRTALPKVLQALRIAVDHMNSAYDPYTGEGISPADALAEIEEVLK